MVNYDLPWNPNRIEQRFGRIHRIGQTEVCHLWNLVADDTREGAVFAQLLDQDRGAAQGLPRQGLRRARRGVRGPAAARPAARGDPLRRASPRSAPGWTRSSTRRVGEGLDKLIAERAAHRDMFAVADLEKWRARMDEAQRPPPAAALHQRVLPEPRSRLLGGTDRPNASPAATRSATSPPTSATGTARSAPAPPGAAPGTSG